jgi:hypothetical protein
MRAPRPDRLAPYLIWLYFSYGLTLAGIGAAWPASRQLLGARPDLLGVLFLSYGVARALGAWVVARISRRTPVGWRVFAWLQLCGAAALLAGFVTTSWIALLAALVIYGVVMGALDLAGSAAALGERNRRLYFAANAAFATGTVAGPLLVAVAVNLESLWHPAEVVPYLLGGGSLLLLIPLIPSAMSIRPSDEDCTARPARDPWSYVLLIVAVAGAETALGAWVPSFSAAAHGTTAGAYAATAYWTGFAISRLVTISTPRRRSEFTLAAGATALVIVIIAAVYLTPTGVSIAAFFLAGAALGPAYPLLVADQAAEGSPRIIARAIVISTAGSAAFPALAALVWDTNRQVALLLCGCAPLAVLIVSRIFTKLTGGAASG